MITLNEAQQRIESTLNGRYDKDELRSIVRELLTEATSLSRSALLLADKDTLLSTEASQALSRYLDRMKTGMPLQYAVGHAPFLGHEFAVNPSVLIPRPETEELVELILRKERPAAAPLCLLDVGTGSGCLAITLARELRAKVWAMDISPDALATARTNVGEDDRIFFFEGDILSPDNRWDVLPPVDIIVSNPPYIMPAESADMAYHVLGHEPALALFAPEEDPLLFYKAIANFSGSGKLRSGGRLYVELNPLLAEATCEVFSAKVGWCEVRLHTDLSGKSRFLSAKYLPANKA